MRPDWDSAPVRKIDDLPESALPTCQYPAGVVMLDHEIGARVRLRGDTILEVHERYIDG